MLRATRFVLLFCLSAPAMPLAAQHDEPGGRHAHAPTLGTVVFPNSGNATAQPSFLRGIALLHSFEYEESAEALRQAQEADPAFALAYWGEALTYSHVLWRTEDLEASRAALRRLAPTGPERLAKAGTARERSFGEAVEAFYAEGTLADRIQAYAAAMRRHAHGAEQDHEAAAFAAHALLLNAYVGDRGNAESLTREAIALAQRVAQANPNHPGAAHYLIHAYDTPGMAAEGLPFARAYDQIAPDAEHALHMPSHIYLQLGLWQDVVRSNERAWAASRAASSPDWHAFAWLQYGYLQQGRWAAARGLIDTVAVVLDGRAGYADAAFVLPRLEFQYAAETGKWQRPVTPPRPASAEPASDRERAFRASARYWLAVDAVQRKTPDMETLAAPFVASADSVRAGGAGPAPGPAANALTIAALAAGARGDTAARRRALQAATEQERRLTAFVGPPERVFALELLGAELHAEGEYAEAARAFEAVLQVCPNRSQSLFGLARAHVAAGNRVRAAGVLGTLRENWARADPEVLALLESKSR